MIVIDVTTIPMEQFSLRWRFTDPDYRILPAAHLQQIQPLDAASAQRMLDLTSPWHDEQPFTQGVFAKIVSTSLACQTPDDVSRVRKWLYQHTRWRIADQFRQRAKGEVAEADCEEQIAMKPSGDGAPAVGTTNSFRV